MKMAKVRKRVSLQNLKAVTEWYKSVYEQEEKQMKLYFGNMVTTVTTLMILSLVGFVGYSISNRNNINVWGRRSLFVLVYGLVICCFAAARDGLDKTIQYTIDGSCNPGIFSLVSVSNIVGCIGAAIIIIAAIATPIAKSQHMREI